MLTTWLTHTLVAAGGACEATALADECAFNLLAAGVDAHAKNHSMLHAGSASRLAPAYELISAHGIWPAERVMFRSAAYSHRHC